MLFNIINEHKQTLGDSEGQGSLACCSPWGFRESDTTERLNNSNKQPGSVCSRQGLPEDRLHAHIGWTIFKSLLNVL